MRNPGVYDYSFYHYNSQGFRIDHVLATPSLVSRVVELNRFAVVNPILAGRSCPTFSVLFALSLPSVLHPCGLFRL